MGYYVSTTILAAASSHDLVDLAAAKDELSITSSETDNWLSRAIRRASGAIKTDTNRVFAPELVCDTFDIERDSYPDQTPGGIGSLNLTRWPVVAIVSVELPAVIGTTAVLTEGQDFRVDVDTGQLLRLNRFSGAPMSWDALPVVVTYVGGYGSVAREEHAVPASAPYTVEPDAALCCDMSVAYDDGATLVRVAAAPEAGEYRIAEGTFTFASADAGKQLAFTFATAGVPADLEDICLKLVTARFRARGRDPALVQRDTPGIGMERWWFGGAPGQKGAFPPDIDAALVPYRVPIVL